MNTQEQNVALPMRSHTILGVCEAIGEDFGFNPILLRVPFAATVLWSPTYSILAYFVLGALVLGSRLLFPSRKPDTIAEATQPHSSASANEHHDLARAA